MKEDNEAVIKALNMYGRVPETWELLEEIERLNDIINELSKEKQELKEKIDKAIEYINENWGHWCSNHYKYATETINILKGSDKE